MAIKSLFLSAFVATVVVSFCASVEFKFHEIPNFSSAICTMEKIATGVDCTKCDFLTFGQDEIIPGISAFCPMTNLEENYCCYGPTRKPFCCDKITYALTGLIWVVAVISVVAVIGKILKFLISA